MVKIRSIKGTLIKWNAVASKGWCFNTPASHGAARGSMDGLVHF